MGGAAARASSAAAGRGHEPGAVFARTRDVSLPVRTISASIGGSYGRMGFDGCRGTRLQRLGRCDGGTWSPAGAAEDSGEDLHRPPSLALTRLPTPPLLRLRSYRPSRRALHRIPGDRLRGDDPAATPLAGADPLALGPIREPARMRQVRGGAEQRHRGGGHERRPRSYRNNRSTARTPKWPAVHSGRPVVSARTLRVSATVVSSASMALPIGGRPAAPPADPSISPR